MGFEGASGLLLILSRLLIVGHPVVFAFRALEAMNAIPIRGFPLAAMLAVYAIVVAVGVAAGRALGLGSPHAVRFTLVALASSLAMDLMRYTTSIFPNNRVPGDTPLYIAATIVYHGAWAGYLMTRAKDNYRI